MMHFAVYDPATGTIKRYGSCAPHDLALQAQPGEAVIETPGPAPDDRHVVDVTADPPMLKPKAT
jgi:hypothetical protein